MVLVDNTDTFLVELGKLFQQTKEKGTVWITSKRCAFSSVGKANSRAIVKEGSVASGDVDYCCLLRATNGKRKVSCMILQKDVPKFHSSYINLMRLHMDKLRKKEKKAKDKKAPKKQTPQ
eukprot:TRINITY_DN7509_c0_g5_i1.p1 TRINITY_DN7509_c0_g5~~TRINITY_DN7509_c0_g5_i1.p1  ORF type:complete len:120 (+),score=35.67 TRINITY_DN7509_c0_g5_i1:66-425(+)